MIPLEAARLGITAYALDYLPVAVMASRLLTDYPCRNWDGESAIPYGDADDALLDARPRLVRDVDEVFSEIGARHRRALAEYYPQVAGRDTWGYLWAITIPCKECSRHFPLVGQLELRKSSMRRNRTTGGTFHDPGQSYYIDTDTDTGTWSVVVHDGPPRRAPTRQVPPGKSKYDSNGRLAVCPFCSTAHDRQTQMRIFETGLNRDAPVLAADIDLDLGKSYRPLEQEELGAVEAAAATLGKQQRFGPFLPAVPDERIPAGNTWTVQATVYGARTYGDMMNARQTLSFILLSRCIHDIGFELAKNGNTEDYVPPLTRYSAALLA